MPEPQGHRRHYAVGTAAQIGVGLPDWGDDVLGGIYHKGIHTPLENLDLVRGAVETLDLGSQLSLARTEFNSCKSSDSTSISR